MYVLMVLSELGVSLKAIAGVNPWNQLSGEGLRPTSSALCMLTEELTDSTE